ncbi:hypothetical protein QJQ45_008576 [Haematococcus lacustris]|nr:hypothetical protein QJQ45_008576 [Haematococcus lacustris]
MVAAATGMVVAGMVVAAASVAGLALALALAALVPQLSPANRTLPRHAMKATVPMATAKVAARWLRKGGRAVVAVISPDGPAMPQPEVTPHGLPDAIKAQLDALLAEYSDVFTPLTGLPPDRPVGHTIPLEPGNRPPATPMYRLSKPEHDELKQQIQDLLAKGMIEPSSSPYAAPVLFVQKKSGELRMCIDYRQLNKITLRDQYPLPRIDDLFDKLSGCKVFSSLDLQAGYHQIRITPEDVPKTAFRTPEGHFQFKVLCFGLTNAPATFQRVMNDAFATVLGKCALVYLDDILVMSKSVLDHLLHLKQVFELLRKNKLYAKLSKSAIAAVPMLRLPDHTKPFQVYCDASLQGLGAVLMQDGYPLAYLSRKLSPAEINYTTGEQEFLSLVTACKEWRCYLEGVPFTLFTDHQPLVALPTQKVLSRRQARWMEFMSRFSYSLVHIAGTVNPADPLSRIVHDSPESVSVCAVTTRRQAKLSLEGGGAREAGLRAAAPAAISAKSPLALSQFEKDTTCVEAMLDPIGSETPVTQDETAQYPAAPAAPMGLSDQLTLGYQQDPAFTAGADHSGMYQDTDGLWRISGKDLVVVPNVPELREHILHEMHDAAYAGHVGMTKTLERVTRVFWWNTVRADVRDYVGTCDACQRDKSSNSKPGGLLRPLTVPGYRWEHVSMDLVTKLPAGTHGYDAICVIVDRLSKMVHFVPCKESMNAMAFTRLFINNVFRLHGLPAEVLTDRGAHFNNKFWHAVKKLLGMKTNMSTAYRPQSDGQTERYNRVLEEMLRHYISPTQADWPDHLALAEFAVNNSWQESIHSTPFFLNTGQSPVTPGLRDLPDGGRCPSAHAFATWWKEGVAHARRHMADAQARYKRHADTGLKDVEFEVGAQVLLSTRNLRIKTGKVRKFVPRYVGPFVVEAKINANAYKLTLPANMSRLHPVFHVSLLKKYSGSDVGIMPPPVEWMDETPVYYVERLLDHRYVRAGKAGEFLVQWEGYDASFNTWEPRANLTGCDKLLAEYNAIHCLNHTLDDCSAYSVVPHVTTYPINPQTDIVGTGNCETFLQLHPHMTAPAMSLSTGEPIMPRHDLVQNVTVHDESGRTVGLLTKDQHQHLHAWLQHTPHTRNLATEVVALLRRQDAQSSHHPMRGAQDKALATLHTTRSFPSTVQRWADPLTVRPETTTYWSPDTNDTAFGAHHNCLLVRHTGLSTWNVPADDAVALKCVNHAIHSATQEEAMATIMLIPGKKGISYPKHIDTLRRYPEYCQHLANIPPTKTRSSKSGKHANLHIYVIWNAAGQQLVTKGNPQGWLASTATALHPQRDTHPIRNRPTNQSQPATPPSGHKQHMRLPLDKDLPTSGHQRGHQQLTHHFTTQPRMAITEWATIAYTDGSCIKTSGAAPESVGAGVYIPENNVLITAALNDPESKTINRAELTAIHAALKAGAKRIATDSLCSLYQIRRALANPMSLITHRHNDILTDIATLIIDSPATIHFYKVRAHSGIIGNEGADALAKYAALHPELANTPAYSPTTRNETKNWLSNAADGDLPAPLPDCRHSVRAHMHRKHKLGLANQDSIYYQMTQEITKAAAKGAGERVMIDTNISTHAQRTALLYRTGGLYNQKLAMRWKRATDDRCPLCGNADSATHLLSGCSETLTMVQERHNGAGRLITKAISKGTLGGYISFADTGSWEKGAKESLALPSDTLHTTLQTLGLKPEDTKHTTRPDILMVAPHKKTSKDGKDTKRVCIIEIKYCSDSRHSR